MNWFGLIQKASGCSILQEIEARGRQLDFQMENLIILIWFLELNHWTDQLSEVIKRRLIEET